MQIKLVGDWKKAERILGTLAPRVSKAITSAVHAEAQLLSGLMRKNVSSGGKLAGKPFAPLSPFTLAVRSMRGRGGSKPLIVTGALRASISVSAHGTGGYFIGIRRRSSGGVDIAKLMEFGGGPWTRPMTARQRKFIAVVLARMGQKMGDGGGRGSGTITVQIPPRPFIGPVIEKFGSPDAVVARMRWRVARALDGDIGNIVGGTGIDLVGST